MLIKDTCETARAIMAGELDSDISFILEACKARTKSMFRKGSRVRLVNTRNVSLEGAEGTIVKVNQKSVTVGVGEKDEFGYLKEYNVPLAMLEAA